MKSYPLRLACNAAFALLAELVWAACVRAVAADWKFAAVLSSAAMPCIGHLSYAWFADEKGRRRRWGLTAAASLGCGAGMALVMCPW